MNSEEKRQKALEILNSNPSQEDLQIAIGLVKEAMADGLAGAFCTMGGIYCTGVGVGKDENKAFECYQKSLDMGYERAKIMLARYYAEGKVVEKNLPLAEQYLRDLAAKDDPDACSDLANYLLNDVFPNDNKEEGEAMMEKAAKLGNPWAMANLGCIYGNMCNDEKAMYWFNLARENGVDVTETLKQYSPETYNDRCTNLIKFYFSQKQYKEVFEFTEREAKKGDIDAWYGLANYCANGLGEELYGRDIQKAVDIYNKLWAEGQVHAYYMLGRMYGRIEDIYDSDKSFSYYMKAANAGDADAMFSVGVIYNEGLGNVDVNKDEAVKWMEAAAELNQRDALCHIACSYLQDPDISTFRSVNFAYEQDAQKGLESLRRAAQLGQPYAIYVLALCYLKGKYVEKKDENTAFMLMQDSVRMEAMPVTVRLLGDFYRDGIGTEQNYQVAASNYSWASQNGDFSATYSLSYMYANGLGVEKNEEYANELLMKYQEQFEWNISGKYPLSTVREEAKNGNPDAMYQLGNRYHQGDGVEQNIEVASDWWHRAATQGHVLSIHNLGMYYLRVNHDVDNALKWLEKAAEKDSALSLYTLGDIYLYGQGVEVDTDKALDYLNRAAELNSEDAQFRLAGLYHEGTGVEKDFEKARYWFDKYYEHDTPMSHFYMALNLLNGDLYPNDYQKALEEVTVSVKGGCHEAIDTYIRLRWGGDRVEADKDEVISVLEELAGQNDAVAMYHLFTLYNDDDYDKKDSGKALDYLKASVDLGYDQAIGVMGLQYQDGGLFPTDYAKANEYFTQAAQKGNAVAMVNLAISCEYGRGMEKDMKRALKCYEDAARLGEAYGAVQASVIYYNGVEGEIEPDIDRAIQLLENYADQDVDACAMLGQIYVLESNKDDKYTWELAVKSYELMKKASEAGNMDATYSLANMYLEGRGVDIDLENAKELFNKCIEAGFNVDECKKKLEDFLSDKGESVIPRFLYWLSISVNNRNKYNLPEETYQDADGNWEYLKMARDAAECGERNAQEAYGYFTLKNDPDVAFQSFAKAIKQGKTDLALTFGRNYYYGQEGVEENVERAVEYFQLGTDQGDLICAMYLANIYSSVEDKEARDYAKELYSAIYSESEEDSYLEKSSAYHLGQMLVQEIEEGRSLDDMEHNDLMPVVRYCCPNGRFKLFADAFVKIAEKLDHADFLTKVPFAYAYADDFQTAQEVIDYCESNNLIGDELTCQKGIVNSLKLNDSEALHDFASLEDFDSSIVRTFYSELLLKKGMYQEAIDFVSRADEPEADMLVIRGKAYEKLGLGQKAVEDFTNASIMPVDDDVELAPADALLHLGKYEECKECISQGLDELEDGMSYSMCMAYNNAAYYYCLMGDKDKAVEYFNKSVETGYLLFDYMQAYKPELMQYPEVQEYINNYKSQK